MTIMAEHTSRPWQLASLGNAQKICEPSGTLICRLVFEAYFTNPDKHVANAEHIVRCVNVHDELLAVCERLLEVTWGPAESIKLNLLRLDADDDWSCSFCGQKCESPRKQTHTDECPLHRTREAIAKVKGKTPLDDAPES